MRGSICDRPGVYPASMRASELRTILVGIACASCGTAAAPQPTPAGAEPVAPSEASPTSPESPAASAPGASVSASASASPAVTAVASASAHAAPSASTPAPDPRAARGPGGEVLWRVGLASDASDKLSRTCQGRTGLSVSCSVPDQLTARVARADAPAEACPKQGPVLEIRCSGCGGPEHPGGAGALQEALTRGVRQHVPAACCYAGCVPLPRPPPPNAGRPFVVGGALRTASLVALRRGSARSRLGPAREPLASSGGAAW